MDWRPVQAVPYLSPKDSWDKLQPFHDPELDKQLNMDGWINGYVLK